MLVQEVLVEEDVEDEEEVVDTAAAWASASEAADDEEDDEGEELAWRKTAAFGLEAAAPAGREKVVPLQQPVFWSIAVSQQYVAPAGSLMELLQRKIAAELVTKDPG